MPLAQKFDLYDFELEISSGAGRDYPLAVLRSPAGEIRQTLHFPYDELALENRLKSLEIALLRSGGKHRRVLSPEEQNVQNFGQELFNTLFSGEARSLYDLSSEKARREGKGLRVKLRVQAPELASLPWEYLYDARQAEYVCLSRDTPVIRYIELPQAVPPFQVSPPLRILGMVASPSDLPLLDLENEKQRVERALAQLRADGLIDLTWIEGQTWRDIQRAMRSGDWHIFHFIGHGEFDTNLDQGVVALADERGLTHRLMAIELGRLLADHRSLRLVVLNSCESGRGGTRDIFSSTASILVRRGIPAVLAMQYAITDRAAIEFSRAFYEALADGFPVDMAVCEARKSVSVAVANSVEWGMPVLYMRSPDGCLFELAPASKQETPRREKRSDAALEKQRLVITARQKLLAGDWSQAAEILEPLAQKEPEDQEISAMLGEAHRWLSLAERCAAAAAEKHAGRWREALTILREVDKQQPGYRDTAIQIQELERLLAQQERNRQRQKAVLEAQAAMRSGDWQQAAEILQPLAEQEPQDAEVARLLDEVQNWLRKADLYARGVEQIKAGSWQSGLELFNQLERLHPGYRDADRQIEKCQRELAAQQVQQEFALKLSQARTAIRQQEWHKAEKLLDALRLQQPTHSEVQALWQQAHKELETQDMYQQAVSQYLEAVNMQTRVGNPHLALDSYRQALVKFQAVRVRQENYRETEQYIAKTELTIAYFEQTNKSSPVPPGKVSTDAAQIQVISLRRFAIYSLLLYVFGLVVMSSALEYGGDVFGVFGFLSWVGGLCLNVLCLAQARKIKAEAGQSPSGTTWHWALVGLLGVLPIIYFIGSLADSL